MYSRRSVAFVTSFGNVLKLVNRMFYKMWEVRKKYLGHYGRSKALKVVDCFTICGK